jgi:hypothetical protein
MEARDYIRLSIVYQIEKNRGLDLIDTSGYRGVVEPEIHQMLIEGYIAVDGDRYLLAHEGVKLRNKMLQALDQVRPFEVFANVRTDCELSPHESGDGVQVFDDVFDPRFRAGTDGEDLRLCMYELFGAEAGKEGKVNLHLIVFLQKLLDEEFLSPGNFWPNLKLGILNAEIDKIIASSVSLESLAPDDEDIAGVIYTTGMIEARKRAGQTCSRCGIPLAIFEMMAEEEGRTLDCCPGCQASYLAPAVEEVVVEGTVVYESVAPGVYVDFWYEPVVYYYDPFDAAIDTLAFAILLDVIW